MTSGTNYNQLQLRLSIVNTHIATLTEMWGDFFDSNKHYPLDLIPINGGTEHELRIPEVPILNPAGAVILGDIAHGLRSVLDNLACQLAYRHHIEEGGTDTFATVTKQVAFPICTYKKGDVNKGPGEPFSPTNKRYGPIGKYLPALESFQPYAVDKPTHHFLWLLSVLNNADKHRMLVVVAAAVVSTMMKCLAKPVEGPDGNWSVGFTIPQVIYMGKHPFVAGRALGRIKCGDIAAIRGQFDQPSISAKLIFGPDEASLADLPVKDILFGNAKLVHRIVKQFEPILLDQPTP